MAPSYRNRCVDFRVDGGRLIRDVRGTRFGLARHYETFADFDVLAEVAWFIGESCEGTTTSELWEAFPDLPQTQISVALDFLKDRGVAFSRQRRVHPTSDCTFQDAMLEFFWLQHAYEVERCGM